MTPGKSLPFWAQPPHTGRLAELLPGVLLMPVLRQTPLRLTVGQLWAGRFGAGR